MSKRGTRCQLFLNPGWTCIQHHEIKLRVKIWTLLLSAIGGLIASAFISGFANILWKSIVEHGTSPNPLQLWLSMALFALIVVLTVIVGAFTKENSVLKYVAIGSVTPYTLFQGILSHIEIP